MGGGKVPTWRSNARSDRYEPLPGLTEIPGFLIRKLSPRGRKIAAVLGPLLLVAVGIALAISIPKITDTKAERAAAERRAQQQHEAALVAELKAEQRLRSGAGTPSRGLEGSAAIEARRQLATQLGAAVQGDAAARVRAGEFRHPVQRVECERYPRGARGEDPATDPRQPGRPLLLPGDHRRRAAHREEQPEQHRLPLPRARSTSPPGSSRSARSAGAPARAR